MDQFQPKKPDLSPIDEVVAGYQALSRADDAKGTEAAQEAAQRASFVRKWKAAMEQRRVMWSCEPAAQASQRASR